MHQLEAESSKCIGIKTPHQTKTKWSTCYLQLWILFSSRKTRVSWRIVFSSSEGGYFVLLQSFPISRTLVHSMHSLLQSEEMPLVTAFAANYNFTALDAGHVTWILALHTSLVIFRVFFYSRFYCQYSRHPPACGWRSFPPFIDLRRWWTAQHH